MSVLALQILYDRVVALLAEELPHVNVVFGWLEPAKLLNKSTAGAARVCFVPGDSSDSVGRITAPKWPGRNPRPIFTLEENFRVLVWAVDKRPEAISSERAQVVATRLLLDEVLRALKKSDVGGLVVKSATWVKHQTERQFGMEIELNCMIEAKIPDHPAGEVLDLDLVFSGDLVPSVEADNG